MKYTIIEDCSPYYIRFTHEGIEDIIEFCNNRIPNVSDVDSTFIHHRMSPVDAKYVLSRVPMSSTGQMNLQEERVSLFITKPGRYYRAHKDGMDHRASINYAVKILDDKCVTSWYSDEDLKNYPIDNLPRKTSRECVGFVKENHTPLKSMTAVQGECILFNTELFHDWDNRASNNYRVVLTLRSKNPGNVYFDDIKRILFGK